MESANGSAHKRSRICELVDSPLAMGIRSWSQSSTLLHLVADSPIGIRNLVLLQEVKPNLSRRKIHLTIAICTACAPLCHKQRDAVCKGRSGFLPVPIIVSIGVEVQCVCEVGADNRIEGGLIDILRPCLGAKNDEVIAMLPNHRYELLMIRLDDASPTLMLWLVERLEDDICCLTIKCCHIAEKHLGFWNVLFCIVIVPINDYIDTKLDSSVNHRLNTCCLHIRILQKATHLHPHGYADQAHRPIFLQPIHSLAIVVL